MKLKGIHVQREMSTNSGAAKAVGPQKRGVGRNFGKEKV